MTSMLLLALVNMGMGDSADLMTYNYTWLKLYDKSSCIEQRIQVPDGYRRVDSAPGSFEDWLRHLPLKDDGSRVYLFDGRMKTDQEAHHAVVNIDVGDENLLQCADVVIRLRAEYLYSHGSFDSVHFTFTNGDTAYWRNWIDGNRPIVAGGDVRWICSEAPDSSYECLREYLKTVFTYAGSYSLKGELTPVDDRFDMRIGDIFVRGGFPGHAVMVVDMAADIESGEKLFLLMQGFMPAQDAHILKNPDDSGMSPWYRVDNSDSLFTPEWIFGYDELMRFR
jgi:hypothetical protein